MDMAFIHRQARAKALELSDFFDEVQESLRPEKIEVTLNTLFLSDACESCFIDMERHKSFHRIETPDRHKRAAFIFKWLARIRPINVAAFIRVRGNGKVARINAYFALLCALGELNVDMAAFSRTKVAMHIIYSAAYRDINPETWALVFCLLERQFPKSANS